MFAEIRNEVLLGFARLQHSSLKRAFHKEMQILNSMLLNLLSLHCDLIVQSVHNEPGR